MNLDPHPHQHLPNTHCLLRVSYETSACVGLLLLKKTQRSNTTTFVVEMLGIETLTTAHGAVCNGITDHYTRIDNLYLTFVLARVNLPVVMVTLASACTLPDGLVIRTAV